FVFFVVRISEQAFLALQIAEGADVGQGKSEAVLVFIADRFEGETPVFEADAAAIPVVSGLHGCVLKYIELAVETDVRVGAPPSLGWTAIAELSAELIKQRLHAGRLAEDVGNAERQRLTGVGIGDHLARHLQIGMAGADKEVAEVKSGVKGAGVDAP